MKEETYSLSLSEYKFKKIAIESFKNGLRLYDDAIILYKFGSLPSSFQMAILALEEIAKSDIVENYWWCSRVNGVFPDINFEQKWLCLLYNHTKKQKAFPRYSMNWNINSFKTIKFASLESRKQQAVYVGLSRVKSQILIRSRISVPIKAISRKEVLEILIMLAEHLKNAYERKIRQEVLFDIKEKDDMLDEQLYQKCENLQMELKSENVSLL